VLVAGNTFLVEDHIQVRLGRTGLSSIRLVEARSNLEDLPEDLEIDSMDLNCTELEDRYTLEMAQQEVVGSCSLEADRRIYLVFRTAY